MNRAFMFAVCLTMLFSLTFPSLAQGPSVVGEVRPEFVETSHPYPRGSLERESVWSDTITSPGATFLRLHFVGFSLAEDDFVTVSSLDGSEQWTYRDRGPNGNGNFWSFAVSGETAIVTLHAGPENGYGYRIQAVGHGTGRIFPQTEVVCGTDGRQPIECHTGDTTINTIQQPVARLLYLSGPFLYACTGWLVDGTVANMLVTNGHCLSSQQEVDTLQADFNYQTGCYDNTLASYTTVAGGTLLRTNGPDRRGSKDGLDYSLLTLQGTPERTFGKLSPSASAPSVGEQIWFPQHPGGRPKEIGYFEEATHTAECSIHEVDQTYGRSVPGSQIGYSCDSEGGSSGSPILNTSGQVVGLHHFGGVDNNPCLNGATSMSFICQDASDLLSCAGSSGGIDTCDLLPSDAPCASDDECCSGKCKGKPGERTCN